MSTSSDGKKSVEPLCLAAIDVGSNSTHMLIVKMVGPGGFQILENQREQTRLAADIDARLMLDTNALSKMAIVLRRMKEVALRYGAVIRCIATHPLREARNGVEFASRLSARVGIPIEIVSGQEEARLVSLGVLAGLSINEKASLIVDVGGGSAEIVLCQRSEVRFATSLKLGAVRLTKKFLNTDPFSDSDLRELESYVRSRLEPLSHELKRFGFDLAVGSSGTIKALKALANGIAGVSQPGSFHGSTLSHAELESVAAVLVKNRSVSERRMLPGLDAKRADIIVAGAVVLRVLAEVAGVTGYTISTSALREGILFDTLAREAQWLRGDSKDIRWQSIREFGSRLQIDEPHAFHIVTLTMSLFDALSLNGHNTSRWRELLRCAAYLHECGKFINISGFHKHAQYLIKNSNLLGFSQWELEIVASLVRFHRKRTPRPDEEVFENLEKSDQVWVNRLASVLRLAVSLDRGRIGRIRSVGLTSPRPGKMVLSLSVSADSDPSIELYDLECEKAPFEKAFATVLEVCRNDIRS